MADTGITIAVRTRGTAQTKRELDGVSRAARAVGTGAVVAGHGLRNLRDSYNLSATAGYAFRRSAYVVGAGVASIGVLAIKSGLQFNSSMEQNQVAFTQFLGSSKAAKAELGTLFQLAAHTPFEMTQITMAERRLLAFNFSLKESNSWLKTIGDTAAGSGQGAEGIDRMVTALGQIKAKGRLQGDELLQLSELGVLDPKRLAKDLGTTTQGLFSGNQFIPATKALRAIKKQFDDTFGGQSAKQAKTFAGQWSTLHDNVSQTLGTLTGPLFKDLERKVFPALNSTAERLNQVWSGGGSTKDKMALSRTAIRHRLGPLADEAEKAIGDMHIGSHLTDEFEKAVPKLADAAGHAAPKIAGALVNGFLSAGPYGKIFALGYLAKKMGVFKALGGLAGDYFVARFGPKVAAAVAGETAATAAAGAGGGALGAAGKGAGFGALARGAYKLGPKVARFAGPAGAALTGVQIASALTAPKNNGAEAAFEAAARAKQRRAGGLALPPLPKHLRQLPTVVVLKVDGKTLAHVDTRAKRDAKARR